MKPSVVLVATALVAGSAHVALARDHMELVCSAVADAKDGGDRIPLFIHLFENRSSNGVDRDEMLSTIYQGHHFQATRVNKSGNFSTDAPIVLRFGKTIRFRGKYTIDSVNGDYVLKLNGEVNDDPPARKATFRTASATLTCVDLSI